MPEPYSDEEIAHYEPPDFDRTTREIRVVIQGSLRLKATIDADRKKIVDYKNMLNQRAACYIKAKQEVKGLKNRIEELKEALDRAITEMETWRDLDDCECESGEHICGLQRLKESIKIARAAQGEEGEKK